MKYYEIALIDGLDCQILSLSDKQEALRIADQLRFFFLKQGKKIEVALEEIEEEHTLPFTNDEGDCADRKETRTAIAF